ncbi:MAG: hypothetical protein ACXITV_01230 [Luteibaculaceae bacterium]
MFIRKKFSILALFIGLLIVTACNRDPDPTTASILVVDLNGTIQPGAEVRLFGKASGPIPVEGERIDLTKIANEEGVARFDLSEFYQKGQTGFAILDIRARQGILEGTNIIRITEEKNNEATVIIQ